MTNSFMTNSFMTKVFPFPYTQTDYPNGLRLLTVPTPFPHIVSLYIVVQVGSRNETEAGKSGFAHLFEHMMFRGTERFPPEAYDSILKRAGAAQNAYTDDDLTVYHTTFTREDLDTILEIEADRFQNLQYSEEVFRTESRAVLAEYNKDSAEPFILLDEKLRAAAFTTHPYRHTTMGFLEDVKAMPELYEFSRQFHTRYYRPEYTTIIVSGAVDPGETEALVQKHWGAWQRGSFVDSIPVEPPFAGPGDVEVPWPSPTLPLLSIAYRGPAYTDTAKDSAALDVISYLAFSASSPLYEKLVLEQQYCDIFQGYCPDHADPYLYLITARLKDAAHLDAVRAAVEETLDDLRRNPVDPARLERVKTHLRYSFAMRMNESEAIAGILARYVALRRSPDTIERLYAQYAAITPEDLQAAANHYFQESKRLSVVLRHSAGIEL
jgi:zinc protease